MFLMNKKDRFEVFVRRLKQRSPANSSEEAFNLIADILNQVENELTDIPYSPTRWMTDGRMYPPQADSKRSTTNSQVSRYRSKGHNTYIASNGAIMIESLGKNKTVFVDKPGKDNKKVGNL